MGEMINPHYELTYLNRDHPRRIPLASLDDLDEFLPFSPFLSSFLSSPSPKRISQFSKLTKSSFYPNKSLKTN